MSRPLFRFVVTDPKLAKNRAVRRYLKRAAVLVQAEIERGCREALGQTAVEKKTIDTSSLMFGPGPYGMWPLNIGIEPGDDYETRMRKVEEWRRKKGE